MLTMGAPYVCWEEASSTSGLEFRHIQLPVCHSEFSSAAYVQRLLEPGALRLGLVGSRHRGTNVEKDSGGQRRHAAEVREAEGLRHDVVSSVIQQE